MRGAPRGRRRAAAAVVFIAAALVYCAPAPAATITVANTNDSGPGSLRQAIADAMPADTVVVPGGTYVLTSGELLVNKKLSIHGAGARSTILRKDPLGPQARVMRVQSAEATISGLTLTGGNPQPGNGGALLVSTGSKVTLLDGGVVGNHSGPGGSGFGGGISNSGDLTLERVLVAGNTAGQAGAASAGGAIEHANGTLTLLSSTVSQNLANGSAASGARGGGILNGNGKVVIVNSTLAGNTALGGSGNFLSRGGNLHTAGSSGGTGPVTIANSIISGGSAGTLQNCSIGTDGSITSGGGNLEATNTCNFFGAKDQRDTNPLLGPLQNNGGPTDTHALPVNSPAVNAADPVACRPNDQRGIARPQGAGCDGGGFELEWTDLAITVRASKTGVTAGDRVVFTVDLMGGGTGTAAFAGVSNLLPPNAALISATSVGGPCTPGTEVQCPLGGLAPGAKGTATLDLRLDRAGRPTLRARAGSFTPELNPANNEATALVNVAPGASKLTASPGAFPAYLGRGGSIARTRGTRISFRLSDNATMTFYLERPLPGRSVGGKCVVPRRSNRNRPRCTRWVRSRGSLSRSGKRGNNSFRFTGRWARLPLALGNYRFAAVPSIRGLGNGRTAYASFRVKR